MLFEEAWEVVKGIPSDGSYYEEEARALFANASQASSVLETGVGYGRSTVVLALAIKPNSGRLTLIDPYRDNESPMAAAVINLWKTGVPFTFHNMRTEEVFWDTIPSEVDFMHVDGDHTVEGIREDYALAEEVVAEGGLLAFHDYGTIPEVKPTVDLLVGKEWAPVQRTMRLAIFRRLHV